MIARTAKISTRASLIRTGIKQNLAGDSTSGVGAKFMVCGCGCGRVHMPSLLFKVTIEIRVACAILFGFLGPCRGMFALVCWLRALGSRYITKLGFGGHLGTFFLTKQKKDLAEISRKKYEYPLLSKKWLNRRRNGNIRRHARRY